MSPRSTRPTIHQDPENIGYWLENHARQTNRRETIHENPDQPGYWFAND